MQQQPTIPYQSSFEPPKNMKRKLRFDSFIGAAGTISLIIAAPILAFVLTVFVFQSYEVDGPSMQQTLQNRDRLIVNKVPRTLARITGNDYIPKRYDIIIFTKHGLEGYGDVNKDKQLVKRVIGLPGDRVVVANGTITVFNSEHPSGYNPDKDQDYAQTIETTPGNTDITIGDGEIFVSGDNRSNSLDSRYFGAVPAKDIVGRLSLRILPIGDAKSF